jgi:DNA-binding LacI/PurR family transcriptional regulator
VAASAAVRLLDRPDPPTAFACGSDTFAAGARLAGGTGEDGLPDVDVVGFDDSPVATLMSPPMSSVRQPLGEAARSVVALLIDQLRGAAIPPEGVVLRPALVPREGGRPAHGRRGERDEARWQAR